MKYFLFLISSFIFLTSGFAQTATPQKVCDFGAELYETSGLVKIAPNKFVTHTDSGNEPKLYVIDSSGNVLRRILVSNATNIDWEDITLDTKNNFYIGDFGNNNNDRQNLRIYIIPNPNTFTKDSIAANAITFTYPDQKAFPPPSAKQNFDMEAFFWFNDSLYLFSKDRSNPYSGYTKCYQLPARNGNFTARLIDSFYTGSGGYLSYSITGAAIFPLANKMVLLGYDKCWLFTGYTGNKFFKGTLSTFSFGGLTQKEGICFENSSQVWFTQENSVLGKAGLYKAKLTVVPIGIEKARLKKLYKLYPNPADDSITLEVAEDLQEPYMLAEIIGMDGKCALKQELEMGSANTFSVKSLKAGKYFIRINGLQAGEFIKL